jgi:hypothetical protein
MANQERDDFDRMFEGVMDEMFGMSSRGEDFDPATGVTTTWRKKDDDTYHTRDDAFPEGTPTRMIRESRYGTTLSRSNTLGLSDDEKVVLIGYDTRNEDTTFDIIITSRNERATTDFKAIYTPDGALKQFEIELRQKTSLTTRDDEEGELSMDFGDETVRMMSPEQNLREIVSLYQLKGADIFKAHKAYDVEPESLDVSGNTPQFILSESLQRRGYTQEDIDKALELGALVVAEHFDAMIELRGLPQVDREAIQGFLTTITARHMIPALENKKKSRGISTMDEDPNTELGQIRLQGAYMLSLHSFMSRYYLEAERRGRFNAEFTPISDNPDQYSFAIKTIPSSSHRPETLFEQPLIVGDRARYEEHFYTVEHTPTMVNLTVGNIFNPDRNRRVLQFPRAFDAKGFQEVIDTEDVASWRAGFEFIPLSYKQE